jgi:hypothetical protein
MGILAAAPVAWVLSVPIYLIMLTLRGPSYWWAVLALVGAGVAQLVEVTLRPDTNCVSATCPGAWVYVSLILWGMFSLIWAFIIAPIINAIRGG